MYNVSVEPVGCVAFDIETFEEAVKIATQEAIGYLPKTPLVQVWQMYYSRSAMCVLHIQSGEGLQTNGPRCH